MLRRQEVSTSVVRINVSTPLTRLGSLHLSRRVNVNGVMDSDRNRIPVSLNEKTRDFFIER